MNINSKLPPIPFFTLERAAKILDCEIDDFLFWNSEGMIPLFIYIVESSSELIFSAITTDCNQCDDIMNKFNDRGKYLSGTLHPLSNFKTPYNFKAKYENYYVEDPREPEIKSRDKRLKVYFNGYAKGIWRIYRTKHWLQPNSFTTYSYKIFDEGKIEIDTLIPLGVEEQISSIFRCRLQLKKNTSDHTNEYIFEKKRLLIDRESIELLLSANGKLLPDKYLKERNFLGIYWNNERHNNDDKMVIKKVGKPQHFYKTFAIDCALLTRDKFAYCKIASISKKLHKKIVDDFNAKNAPTENTIANWLYGIQLGKPEIKSSDDFELVIPNNWAEYSE